MKKTIPGLLAALAIVSFSTVALAEQPGDNNSNNKPNENASIGKADPNGPPQREEHPPNANGGIGNAWGQGGSCATAC